MRKQNNSTNMIESKQQGAVLIVVLLFLILITLVGVMSVKNSNTDLKVATSDQVNTVLIQSADNVNSKIEETVNLPLDPKDPSKAAIHAKKKAMYTQLTSTNVGSFGHFLNDASGLSDEDIIASCFRPGQLDNFRYDTSVIKRNGGNLTASPNGYCDSTKSDHYTSDRGTTMTQLVIDKIVEEKAGLKPFSLVQVGSDSASSNTNIAVFDIYTTSIIPVLSTANTSDINTCVEKSTTTNAEGSVDKQAMMRCMNEKDIVAKQLIENVQIAKVAVTENCTQHAGQKGNSDFCKKIGATK